MQTRQSGVQGDEVCRTEMTGISQVAPTSISLSEWRSLNSACHSVSNTQGSRGNDLKRNCHQTHLYPQGIKANTRNSHCLARVFVFTALVALPSPSVKVAVLSVLLPRLLQALDLIPLSSQKLCAICFSSLFPYLHPLSSPQHTHIFRSQQLLNKGKIETPSSHVPS